MKKLLLITGLMFALVGLVQATEITKTSATATTFKFTATLDALLTTGNKVKIDFGKGGLKAMTCSAKTCTLSSNALPTGISTATYKIGIYDARNVLQGSTSDGTYVISSSSNETVSTTDSITTDYSKTTGYTKIANNGSTLPDSAKLGVNPTDWACTQDNKTGLIWEIKTDNPESPLRFKDSMYTNYTADYPKCNDGGAGWCSTLFTGKYGDSTNTDGFVKAVNATNLCGKNDWRLPTVDELLGIVKSGSAPPIDTFYFPDIKSNYGFWSSSPYADRGLVTTLYVSFIDGHSYGLNKIGSNSVRLVR